MAHSPSEPTGDDDEGSASGQDAEPSFADRVVSIVRDIPEGRVMSYGDIAAVLGSRGARVVGRVMAATDASLPWWRVVRADGTPPACHDGVAATHYASEGTPMRGSRIRMDEARWDPLDEE